MLSFTTFAFDGLVAESGHSRHVPNRWHDNDGKYKSLLGRKALVSTDHAALELVI